MFYLKTKKKILNFFLKIYGYDINKWCLAVIDTNFKNLKNIKHTLIIPPKNKFWADPFVIKIKKKIIIFFEEYDYTKRKGHICCAELKNKKLINKKIIINKKYHLSYPNVFILNKNYYLIPETHTANNVQIYKSSKFPYKWKLYKTIFKNKSIVDTTFSKILKKNYIFFNERYKNEEANTFNKRLKIYIINNLLKLNITKHDKNPVILNNFKGRNAGSIFKIEKKFYRPSQINNDNLEYGYALAISEIKKIDQFSYVEQTYKILYPEFFGPEFFVDYTILQKLAKTNI